MSHTISIRIPDNLRDELVEISKHEKKPVSELIRESLRKYTAIYRFRKLRNKVLPFAEAEGILTDEDVMEKLF